MAITYGTNASSVSITCAQRHGHTREQQGPRGSHFAIFDESIPILLDEAPHRSSLRPRQPFPPSYAMETPYRVIWGTEAKHALQQLASAAIEI